jgi:hypothetical protein
MYIWKHSCPNEKTKYIYQNSRKLLIWSKRCLFTAILVADSEFVNSTTLSLKLEEKNLEKT